MGRASKKTTKLSSESHLPAPSSQEEREIRCSNLAMDLAEQQLMDGTASSQVITHFLKVSSIREQEELKKLKHENNLLIAKTKAYENAEDIKKLYEDAISAMKVYTGSL